MGKIAPSILSADILNLGTDIEMLDRSKAEWIHIDVMDGHFVPNLTFGANVVEAVRTKTDKYLDVHLMVEEPGKMIDAFIAAGADGISIHAEKTKGIHQIIKKIKENDIKAGIVINPETPVSAIEPLLSYVDTVLVMTVNPGFGGQPFIPEMLKEIEKLDQYRNENNLNYLIEVDGGINNETIQACNQAGADVFVAGSNIFNATSPEEQIGILKNLVD